MPLSKMFLNLGLARDLAELVTILVILLALSAVFWLVIGRFRLHNFLISIYVSFALVQVFPTGIISFTKNSSLFLFVVLLVLLTLFDRYLFDIHQYGSGLAIWQVVVMSFLEMLLLSSIIVSFLQSEIILQYISKNSLAYFVNPWWQVVWMALPLAFLAFAKKR